MHPMCRSFFSLSASRSSTSFAAGAALPRSVFACASSFFARILMLSGTTSTAGEMVTSVIWSVRRCVSASKYEMVSISSPQNSTRTGAFPPGE